jgi:hypothetical protein
MDTNDKELIDICLKKRDYEILTMLYNQKKFNLEYLVRLLSKKRSQEEDDTRYLLVTYDISGWDHDGYCSGECGGDSGEEDNWQRQFLYTTTKQDIRQKYGNLFKDGNEPTKEQLEEFDDGIEGCTSSVGSGYCKKMRQKRKCIKLELLEELN